MTFIEIIVLAAVIALVLYSLRKIWRMLTGKDSCDCSTCGKKCSSRKSDKTKDESDNGQ